MTAKEKLFTQDDLDDTMAEAFVAGALSARHEERKRLHEALVASGDLVVRVTDVLKLIGHDTGAF
jgi:anti-sigma-K factor RskA